MIAEAIQAGQYVLVALLCFAAGCGALAGLVVTAVAALGARYGWWTSIACTTAHAWRRPSRLPSLQSLTQPNTPEQP